ncbi:hypothetical protein H0E87_010759 [Populus deltoides]|uniref:Uncharacterized protein n=1 Tax=Populus deltoides TaxID=3696 RepID=A0A8T2YUN0_POPDE|nr:hypothetical protein H0E87_010759 [Populus deltoides]
MNKALLKEYLIVLPDNQNRICSGNYRCAYSLNSTESEYGFVEDFDCHDYGVGCWLMFSKSCCYNGQDILTSEKIENLIASVKLNLDGAPKVKPGMPDVRRLCTQIGTSIGMDFRVQEVHPK